MCFGFFWFYFVFKEKETFCIKKQFGEYFPALQNPGKFCGTLTRMNAKMSCHEEMMHTDAAAASLSKGAFKLVFDEASPDLESQSNTQPAVNASFTS